MDLQGNPANKINLDRSNL